MQRNYGLSKAVGAVNLRYGFILKAGSEEEKIVGNVAVAHPDSDDGKRTWQQPKVEIVEPTGKSVGKASKVDVRLKISDAKPGQRKIGWFTSSGKFKNRRSTSTIWETGKMDKQLLIATVREKRSHGFAIAIAEFATND